MTKLMATNRNVRDAFILQRNFLIVVGANGIFECMKKYILLLLCIASIQVFGQPLLRSYTTTVSADGFYLQNPWAGGLNSCQISRIDANGDGNLDIFIFDRIGSRISIFINMGDVQGDTYYRYTLEYNSAFPNGLTNWVLLRDYNCDGKEDIFANYYSGIKLWKNTSSNGVLSFEPVNNGASIESEYDFGSPFSAPIYTVSLDVPSTNYICGNRCYGMFGESPESFSILEGADFDCGFNVTDPRSSDRLHTGSSICSIDLDNNGIKDFVIGDVSENNLGAIFFENAVNGLDSATTVQFDFPVQVGNSLPVNLPLFPCAYYEDVNNNAVSDLLVSPNAYATAEDVNSVWYYENIGGEASPQFQFVMDDFLQHDMIELGTGAYPVLEDVNGDGLKDLLITNRKSFDPITPSNNHTSRIFCYYNNGTPSVPSFDFNSNNWLPLATDTLDSKYITFGDDDGDGDKDLLIGVQNGYLVRFENAASTINGYTFSDNGELLKDNNGLTIDVGQFATPQYVDLNDDGLLDLAVGEKNGNVNFYANIGSANAASYEFREDTLGGMVATNVLGIFGYSVPHFFKNELNLWEVLLGTETGQVNHFSNVSGNLLGDFTLDTTDFEGINEGERCAVWFEDITADGKRDLFIGQIGGGLGFYSSDTIISVIESLFNDIQVYPNPASTQLTIDAGSNWNEVTAIELYDLSGRRVWTERVNARTMLVNLSNFSEGIYVLKLNGTAVRKKVIVRK
ncbi:MAG: hypothetical protein RL664_908 [Bacteroidota bacterium]